MSTNVVMLKLSQMFNRLEERVTMSKSMKSWTLEEGQYSISIPDASITIVSGMTNIAPQNAKPIFKPKRSHAIHLTHTETGEVIEYPIDKLFDLVVFPSNSIEVLQDCIANSDTSYECFKRNDKSQKFLHMLFEAFSAVGGKLTDDWDADKEVLKQVLPPDFVMVRQVAEGTPVEATTRHADTYASDFRLIAASLGVDPDELTVADLINTGITHVPYRKVPKTTAARPKRFMLCTVNQDWLDRISGKTPEAAETTPEAAETTSDAEAK